MRKWLETRVSPFEITRLPHKSSNWFRHGGFTKCPFVVRGIAGKNTLENWSLDV